MVKLRRTSGPLHEAEYSLQANRKTLEGTQHPDRNAQFEYINAKVLGYMQHAFKIKELGKVAPY